MYRTYSWHTLHKRATNAITLNFHLVNTTPVSSPLRSSNMVHTQTIRSLPTVCTTLHYLERKHPLLNTLCNSSFSDRESKRIECRSMASSQVITWQGSLTVAMQRGGSTTSAMAAGNTLARMPEAVDTANCLLPRSPSHHQPPTQQHFICIEQMHNKAGNVHCSRPISHRLCMCILATFNCLQGCVLFLLDFLACWH